VRLANYEFSPSLAATLATLLLFPLLISLGIWQLNRADEKRAIEDQIHDRQQKAPLYLNDVLPEQESKLLQQVYRAATAEGHYDSEHQFLYDNRTHNGKPGYHVLTPFILRENDAVLVNRGWIPYIGTRDNIQDISVGMVQQVIHGNIKAPSESIILDKALQADNGYPQTIQAISLLAMEEQLEYKFLPVIIELDAKEKKGFVREWQPYYGSIARHVGYAIQWFAMAAVLLALYLKYSLKAVKSEANEYY